MTTNLQIFTSSTETLIQQTTNFKNGITSSTAFNNNMMLNLSYMLMHLTQHQQRRKTLSVSANDEMSCTLDVFLPMSQLSYTLETELNAKKDQSLIETPETTMRISGGSRITRKSESFRQSSNFKNEDCYDGLYMMTPNTELKFEQSPLNSIRTLTKDKVNDEGNDTSFQHDDDNNNNINVSSNEIIVTSKPCDVSIDIIDNNNNSGECDSFQYCLDVFETDNDDALFDMRKSHETEFNNMLLRDSTNNTNTNTNFDMNRFSSPLESQRNSNNLFFFMIDESPKLSLPALSLRETNNSSNRNTKNKSSVKSASSISDIIYKEFEHLLNKKTCKWYSNEMNATYVRLMYAHFKRMKEQSELAFFCESKMFINTLKQFVLEIGISDKKMYDETLRGIIYLNDDYKFEEFLACFQKILKLKDDQLELKFKFLLAITNVNGDDVITRKQLNKFYMMLRCKRVYDEEICEEIIEHLIERYTSIHSSSSSATKGNASTSLILTSSSTSHLKMTYKNMRLVLESFFVDK